MKLTNDNSPPPSAPLHGLPRPGRTAPKDIAADCKHFKGDKPCVHNRLCTDCNHYQPVGSRICIIKIGALGDVIRTLCILPELLRTHPGAHVTWVSAPSGCRMIAGHPMIHRLLPLDAMNALVLAQESFDLVICLDKEPQPCALGNSLFARKKIGMGLSDHGTPIPLNPEAVPYFNLGLSDELKFRQNQKSYPRLVHEALGLSYHGQRYELTLEQDRVERVRTGLRRRGWDHKRLTVGVNVGAGTVFANKMWPAMQIVETVRLLLVKQPHAQVLLLGGPSERPIIDAITHELPQHVMRSNVIDAGTDHAERDFLAIVDACDVLFTGDTMAMHLAIARSKHVVAVFGPTCEQEIDLFGKGEKIVTTVGCAPCYKRSCDQADACVSQTSPEQAVAALIRAMARARTATHSLPVLPARKAG